MRKNLFSLTLASLLCIPSVYADININGFANFTGGMTTSDDDNLYGYDDSLAFDNGSLVALQVRADLAADITATAQLVGRGSDNFDASFEWAYLTYALSDKTKINAGRLRLPLFRYSASLDVGYSYHWIAPPQSVYSVPFNNIDGLRVDYSDYSGDWEYSFQLTGGNIGTDIGLAGQTVGLQVDNVAAASVELSREWFSFRSLYAVGKVSVQSSDIDQLVAGFNSFNAFVPGSSALATQIEVDEDTGTFAEIGIEIDQFTWFVMAEFTRTEVDKAAFSEQDDAWYISAGMRLGKFTPHVTLEKQKADANSQGLSAVAALPGQINTGDPQLDGAWNGVAGQPGLVQTAAGVLRSQQVETKAVTLGLRYDVTAGLALKTDVTWFDDNLDSNGDATLLRLGANYTF